MDAARRLSSVVSGKKDNVFAPTIGNEAQLAKLGYEQGEYFDHFRTSSDILQSSSAHILSLAWLASPSAS